MTTQPTTLDVADFIDRRPMSTLQWRTLVLCGLVNLLDGADSQSIGVAGPLVAREMHLPMSTFSSAFSAGLLGAAIGAVTVGGLADRYGRKRMLVVAVITLSVFTLLTAVTTTFTELIAVRFLAGLGLGGATPCFITLTAEYAPKPSRAALTSLLWAAYPLGASMGSVLNAYLIPALGWRSVFYIGGFLPLLTSLLLITLLPESLTFLARHRRRSGETAAIVRRIDPTTPATGIVLTARMEKVAGGTIRSLFADGRAVGTVLLWGMFFTAFASTTVAVLLMPTLFRSSGLTLSMAALLVGLFNFVAIPSMASAGRLVSKLGTGILVAAFVCGAGVLTLLGHVATSWPLSIVGMALLGLTVPLAASGGIALAALAYPTAIRSTGVGWAMGMGRLGQVVSPLLVGAMLGLRWSVPTILTAVSVVPLIGGVCCLARMVVERRTALAALRGSRNADVGAVDLT